MGRPGVDVQLEWEYEVEGLKSKKQTVGNI